MGSGWGGGLGGVKFILELLNFKEDSASGWGGFGKGWVGVGGLGRVKFILELLNFKEDSASGWGGFGKGGNFLHVLIALFGTK